MAQRKWRNNSESLGPVVAAQKAQFSASIAALHNAAKALLPNCNQGAFASNAEGGSI